MEKQNIILIALAVFSMFIILAQDNLEKAYAITIETATFGGISVNNEMPKCAYLSSTEVWCPTTTGLKIWNPTSRTVIATIDSGKSYNDVKCDGSNCYGWDVVSSGTGNLTKWNRTTHALITFTPFIDNAGGVVGHGISIIADSSLSSNTQLGVPVEGQTCLNGVTPIGTTDAKGVCMIDATSFNAVRFFSSGVTNDLQVIYDSEWNGKTITGSCATCNRLVLDNRDIAGNHQIYVLNMASSGGTEVTFSTAQICNSGTTTVNQESKLTVVGNYVWIDASNQDFKSIDVGSSSITCGVSTKSNPIDENHLQSIEYDSTNNYFVVTGSTWASGTGSVYLFNGTNFAGTTTSQRILKINVTTSTSSNQIWASWIHSSEGEIQVWRGSQIVIISDVLTPSNPNPNTEFCAQAENFNLLRCVLERGDTTPLVGASELVNASSTNIVCQIGLIACTQNEDGSFTPNDPNIQTNGVGYIILFVALGIMIGIYWVASRGDLGSIPTFLWVISTLAIVGVITAFGWIDPSFIVISIIAVIALATAKAKGIFGSGGLFAGET